MKYRFIDNYNEDKSFLEASKLLFGCETTYAQENKKESSTAEIKKVG